jgi:hypothetical protein
MKTGLQTGVEKDPEADWKTTPTHILLSSEVTFSSKKLVARNMFTMKYLERQQKKTRAS